MCTPSRLHEASVVVEVPEWGGSVRARPLSGVEWAKFQELGPFSPIEKTWLASHGMVSVETCERLFDVEEMGSLACPPVWRIAKVIQEISGLGRNLETVVSKMRDDGPRRFLFRLTLLLGHRSVREMLEHMDAYELSEWMAYERLTGPIDNQWRDEAVAHVIDLMNWNIYMQGAKFKRNPWPPPGDSGYHYTRPTEIEKAVAKQALEQEILLYGAEDHDG